MDVLNAVESVQSSLKLLLEKNGGSKGRPSELQGLELAPKTPSELIALSHKVESKPVNLRQLEEFLPEVPIEDQVKVGLGWNSQQKRDDKKRVWETFTIGSLQSDESLNEIANGVKENGITTAPTTLSTAIKDEPAEEEDELEEWEIEAERRFQDSDTDDAPSLPVPVVKKSPAKTKVAEPEHVMKKVNPALETATGSQSAEQDQVKRRRKTWARK
ncbi:hypothetical protein FBU30_009896 [Linnemannia zychae]|nr:hypothetical protein FBU30_009896 [Linnemannia zychae]